MPLPQDIATLISRICECYLCGFIKTLCTDDEVKDFEIGIIVDDPCGPAVITRSLMREVLGESELEKRPCDDESRDGSDVL